MNPEMYALLAWLNLVTLFLVIVGALNWGAIGAFGFNAVTWLSNAVGWTGLATVVYVLVGLAALLHLVSRSYWLPFLGEAAYPCGALVPKTPDGADVSVTVQVAPGANVVFWAAEGKTDHAIIKSPWVAYAEFANTGVAKADSNGNATLSVRKPPSYRVPPFGALKRPHVHYRTCDSNGMLGAVRTASI